jgi:hypothetical protein
MRSVLFSYFRQRRIIVCYRRFGRCLFHLKILPEPHVFTFQSATTVHSRTLKSAGSARLEDFTQALLKTEMLPDLKGATTDVSSDLGAYVFVVKQSFTTSKTFQRTQISHITKHLTTCIFRLKKRSQYFPAKACQ